jgi:hypothetical protein
MTDGYVPAQRGIFFHRKGENTEQLFDFAEALPATSAWLRRAKLEAYLCKKCNLVIFRYGKALHEDDLVRFEHK